MGIRDRDYMKRPPGDDDYSGRSSDSAGNPEPEIATRIATFLRNHPKLFGQVTAAFIGVAVIVLLIAKYSK